MNNLQGFQQLILWLLYFHCASDLECYSDFNIVNKTNGGKEESFFELCTALTYDILIFSFLKSIGL